MACESCRRSKVFGVIGESGDLESCLYIEHSLQYTPSNNANCFDIKRRDPGSRFGNIYVFLLLGFVRSTGSEAGVWRPVASVRATWAVFPRSVVWRFGESWLAYPLLHVVYNSDVWMKKANSEAGVSELGQVSLKRHIMFAQYGGP